MREGEREWNERERGGVVCVGAGGGSMVYGEGDMVSGEGAWLYGSEGALLYGSGGDVVIWEGGGVVIWEGGGVVYGGGTWCTREGRGVVYGGMVPDVRTESREFGGCRLCDSVLKLLVQSLDQRVALY